MKNKFCLFIFCLVAVGLLYSCHSQQGEKEISTDVIMNPATASGTTDSTRLPLIAFTETTHDFGKILQGEKVSCSFSFKNTGKTALLISNVSTSCGCTVADFPRNPILPGEGGVIKIAFNSEGKKGLQNKGIAVIANTQPNVTNLKIKAEVVLPDPS